MRWARHVDGKITLEMDLREIGYEGWTGCIWQAIVNMVMNLWVP
jgi:hypothetical protein